MCAAAARGGYLEILQWARANGCDWDHSVIAQARTDEIRQWARENGCPLPLPESEPETLSDDSDEEVYGY